MTDFALNEQRRPWAQFGEGHGGRVAPLFQMGGT